MKHPLLQILLLSFVFSFSNAQTDFREGYVIENSGDTLHGFIDYRGDLFMGSLCRFKNKNNIITDYNPSTLAAYRFKDSKYFISKVINGKKAFLEFLINGQVNVYYLRDEQGDHYFLEKEGIGISEIPNNISYIYRDEKKYLLDTKKHIGMLSIYMNDAPNFSSKIAKITKPEHKNLIQLAEEYHNSVCFDKKCIIYEKQQTGIKVSFEALSGVVKYTNNDAVLDNFYWQNGVFAHFWLPRINEKIYFKIGFLHAHATYVDGESFNHLKPQAHFGYIASKTYRIRPTASIGLLAPSYSGGLMIRVNQKINVGLQSWLNFEHKEKTFLIPKELANYSILGNLFIEF